MKYDIKTIIKASNAHYGMFPLDQKECGNLDFDVVRMLDIFKVARTGEDLSDYKVVIYSIEPLHMSKTMVYGNMPSCFNCKVHAFDIDFDKKIIFIRSEV